MGKKVCMPTWTRGSWTRCRVRNCSKCNECNDFFRQFCTHSLLHILDRACPPQEKILTLSRHAIEASKPFQVDLKRVLPDGSKIRFLASFRYADLCAINDAALHAAEVEQWALLPPSCCLTYCAPAEVLICRLQSVSGLLVLCLS